MKQIIFKYIFSLALLSSFAFTASSSLNGKITAEDGQPLIGANVMISSSTVLGSATDENGEYSINNIPIGTYSMMIMFIGYETIEETISIKSNQQYTINRSLKPSSIKIQETKVTAEKRREKITSAPASMEIITSRDLKGKSTTNMGAYLKGLKGVDFTSSGINNYSISVRGFNSSFSTRLLTLSDGRVANIPALRVINYSTIPQSMDDVDKIEVVLGPATALYGANAHSGVVNIISKPPSQSEGFSMSISGSNDERQLRKVNGRYAKKINNSLSIKVSGLYLHAYDWPYISEDEYKAHLYPWSNTPFYTSDGKDNNPANSSGNLNNPWGTTLKWEINNSGDSVRIGNGEAMDTGDPDNDGVMGEDWFNGYDDDGDDLIDEDFFIANGIDDDNDGFIDEGIDEVQEFAYDGVDNDNNGIIDDEAGSGLIDRNVQEWGQNIENNLLVNYGRRSEYLINGDANKYYIKNNVASNTHIYGHHRYNEEGVFIEFDVFNYDFGDDKLPGDPFKDRAGDEKYQKGEQLNFLGGSWLDYGLDGIPGTNDEGENDKIWQPGDAWVDGNNNGIIDQFSCLDDPPLPPINGFSQCSLGFGTPDSYDFTINESNFSSNDVYPFANGIWEPGEEVIDCGNDGFCWDSSWTIGEPHQARDINNNLQTYEDGSPIYIYGPDPGELDGQLLPWDNNENDGVFDTGDNIYGFVGENYVDSNNNGRWDNGELFTDTNEDGIYTPSDNIADFKYVDDINGDGLSDYPDFEIDNRKFEFRIDYDPNPDFNMTLQSGYSWSKTQQVTGTGRYIADGFEYKFYQLRSRYKNWFSQFYMNESFSGNTRGYNLGNRILDKSRNYAFQAQNNFSIDLINTKFVWGGDYFRTDPYTYGTILNDGPNGYDNDGDDVYAKNNGVDDDGDGLIDDSFCPDGEPEGFRNGKYWKCTEGIDEPDEFIDPLSNEYGLYYQSTTELFGTSRYELITAARLDYHDLLKEGILFAPKIGFMYKPDSKSSIRITYGKAHNTPNSITLFTDLFIGSFNLFNVYLRGNKDGTPYCRVGEPCFENDIYSVVEPGFFSEDGSEFYTMGDVNDSTYFDGYNERVQGAPYFFKIDAGGVGGTILAGDMLPLDTSIYLIYVPELNGDGVLYSAEESINLPDVDAIKTEKIQTFEFGYKGFLGKKTHFSLDYYLSYYQDFFSPPTIITPFIVERYDTDGNEATNTNFNVAGLMPINDIGTNPPYGTAWNGVDDDGDWEIYADQFGWRDDKNNDGNPSDPGEWGGVILETTEWGGDIYEPGDIFHPYEVLQQKDGYPVWNSAFLDSVAGKWDAVGIDELHSTAGLNEYENVQTGLLDSNGEPLISSMGNARNITDLVLSPMNYGEVWMQGCDIGFTHFVSDKLILDGNISWYGTTEFYNELTKKTDPINAPKWKWNASIKHKSKLGDLIINFRHVDKFKWSDGIWSGNIGPYNIIDLFYTYHINDNLDFNISALNINNDVHRELIGGALMGRQIVMRFSSTF